MVKEMSTTTLLYIDDMEEIAKELDFGGLYVTIR
jgi:hypothetical protein